MSKRSTFIDLTGAQFGLWTVIEYAGSRPSSSTDIRSGGARWLCRCKCNRMRVLDTGLLRSGQSQSCGCRRNPDLSGRRFGRWTVLARAGKDDAGRPRWRCRCACGATRTVNSYSLLYGTNRSCGCARGHRIELTGLKFGSWTVIEYTGLDDSSKHSRWLCECVCGKRRFINGDTLRRGASQSCGCIGHARRAVEVRIDLAGRTFGLWRVLHLAGESGSRWECVCEGCGQVCIVAGNTLRRGASRSCGCAKIRYGRPAHTIPEYRVWAKMIARCKNHHDPAFKHYGGRGIRVCKRWHDFKLFLQDMGPRLSNEHEIDRVDNNGDYEPGNCRWATHIEQANNKRNNVRFEHAGERLTAPQWSRKTGLSATLIRTRILKLGWSAEQALTTPTRCPPDHNEIVRRLKLGDRHVAIARDMEISTRTVYVIKCRYESASGEMLPSRFKKRASTSSRGTSRTRPSCRQPTQ